MPKQRLSFIELHNQLFMQGSNLGNKINAAQKGAKLLLDDERGVVWVYFKGKVSLVPLANVASADAIDISEDLKEALGVQAPGEPQPVGPPAIVRAKRGRPSLNEPAAEFLKGAAPTVPFPDFDPNDQEAALRHRELVRAASANAYRPQPQGPMNDHLIQEARNQAMGLKHTTISRSQVQNAHQVGEVASVTGKKKIMTHAELKAQVAAETKE